MARPAASRTTLELLKVTTGPSGKDGTERLGVLVLDQNEQIPGWGRRIQNLAKDVEVDRLLVVSARDGGFSLTSIAATQAKPQAGDLPSARLAAAALHRSRHWPRRDTVWVDSSGTRVDLQGADPKVPIERRAVWSIATVDSEISTANAETLRMLADCFSSGMGVIPFIGAGLSAPFGFPQWGELLRTLSSGRSRATVERFVEDGRYEDAAQQLYERGRAADRLQAGIMATFKRKFTDRMFAGTAVSLLPPLTCGPVVTTNFDQVLENVFERAGRPFRGTPILGSDPDAFVPAIQRNEHVLFKIHGDCENRRSLTLTLDSYADSYGRHRRAKTRESLRAMLPLLLANRPVLFLGCSLTKDRTLEVVKEVHDRHAGIWHYAVVAAPYDVKAFEARRDELLALGIQPLWFPPGEFECIRDRLRELLEAISVETVYEAPASARPQARGPSRPAENPPLPGEPEQGPEPPRELVNAVGGDRVVFFLGSAAASRLRADEFYEQLAASHGIPVFGRARADAAQHIVDRRKRSTLVAGIKELLDTHVTGPSRTHRVLARLWTPPGVPGGTAPPGWPRLIVMTTNWDRGLELALEDIGRPYHLFVYQAHGEYAGSFLHRSPRGAVRVVRRPENIIDLGDNQPVIAKLNGGLAFARGIPDSFSATNRDFYSLAARIPDALPACLVTALRQRSLLFLGHGLKEPDVEEIVRFCHDHGQPRSWALTWSDDPARTGPHEDDREYWRQLGVELLWGDVDAFVHRLEQALHDRGSAISQAPAPLGPGAVAPGLG